MVNVDSPSAIPGCPPRLWSPSSSSSPRPREASVSGPRWAAGWSWSWWTGPGWRPVSRTEYQSFLSGWTHVPGQNISWETYYFMTNSFSQLWLLEESHQKLRSNLANVSDSHSRFWIVSNIYAECTAQCCRRTPPARMWNDVTLSNPGSHILWLFKVTRATPPILFMTVIYDFSSLWLLSLHCHTFTKLSLYILLMAHGQPVPIILKFHCWLKVNFEGSNLQIEI